MAAAIVHQDILAPPVKFKVIRKGFQTLVPDVDLYEYDVCFLSSSDLRALLTTVDNTVVLPTVNNNANC